MVKNRVEVFSVARLLPLEHALPSNGPGAVGIGGYMRKFPLSLHFRNVTPSFVRCRSPVATKTSTQRQQDFPLYQDKGLNNSFLALSLRYWSENKRLDTGCRNR